MVPTSSKLLTSYNQKGCSFNLCLLAKREAGGFPDVRKNVPPQFANIGLQSLHHSLAAARLSTVCKTVVFDAGACECCCV